jgi:hypothetical protein
VPAKWNLAKKHTNMNKYFGDLNGNWQTWAKRILWADWGW